MNTNKKVFEKLFSAEKTELTSHKYEFGILDDISNFLKSYSVVSDVSPIRSAAEKAEQSLNVKKAKLEEIIKQIAKGKQMSKDLGVPTTEFDKWDTFAAGQMKFTNTLIKNAQTAKFVDNV
jgi:hypothetical protein